MPKFERETWLLSEDVEGAIVPPHTGDFDGDGRSDLVLKIEGSTLTIGMATEQHTFLVQRWGVKDLESSHSSLGFIAAGDLDGDGRSDLVLKDSDTREFLIALGRDGGMFSYRSLHTWSERLGVEFLGLADISCSGRQELLFKPALGKIQSIGISQTGDSVPEFHSTEAKEVVTGTFSGQVLRRPNGCESLLLRESSPTRWSLLSTSESLLWASASDDIDWASEFVGDFNGDGLSDLLVQEGRALHRKMAVYGGTHSGYMRPASAPCGIETGLMHPPVGDIDGDGLSDILTRLVGRTVEVCHAKPGVGIANSEIRVSDGGTIKSSELGTFELMASAGTSVQLTIQLSGFIQSTKLLRIPKSTRRLVTNFVKDDPPHRGQNVGLADDYPGPYACFGYSPGSQTPWKGQLSCPANYFPIAPDQPNRGLGSPAEVAVKSNCCRLPRNDILTGVLKFAVGECPDGFVALGFRGPDPDSCSHCKREIICAQINAERYQLGAPNSGYYWGIGANFFLKDRRLFRELAPPALLEAIGRDGYYDRNLNGCIGLPWGSLLVGISERGCSDYHFRQLQYSGKSGDPEKGTPVQMFPECRAIENIFDPTSGCVE